jgi:hypothetical protein
MTRSFLFVSSFNPDAARSAVLASPFEVELAAISPSCVARLGQALRELALYEAGAALVVIDGLDLLGASTFTIEETGPTRSADLPVTVCFADLPERTVARP